MLSQVSSSSFPDTLQHQGCPKLPHCVTSRLFASVFTKALCLRHILLPYQILSPNGLVYWVISDPATYAKLLCHKLTLCICSDHFGNDLPYLYSWSNPAFPLTVFSFICLGKVYLFPSPATFRFAVPVQCCCHHIQVLLSISALAQPAAVSSALCCTDIEHNLQSTQES